MRIRFILTFLFIGLTLAFGQEVRTYPTDEQGVLWKVTGNEITGDVYILGTIHLVEREYFLFPKSLKKKITNSDELVMELEGLPGEQVTLELIRLEEGSFFDYFTDEEADTILTWVQKHLFMSEEGFRAGFAKFKPFAFVQIAIQLQFMGKTESYEFTLYNIAKDASIPVIGLETIQEQMALFDNLTDDQQKEMVMETVRDQAKVVEEFNKMQILYTEQNIDALYAYITDQDGVISAEQNQFLDARNKKWLPKLKALFGSKNTFVAVGVGHLGGPNGVIRLLEAEGYKLTPIKL